MHSALAQLFTTVKVHFLKLPAYHNEALHQLHSSIRSEKAGFILPKAAVENADVFVLIFPFVFWDKNDARVRASIIFPREGERESERKEISVSIKLKG